MIWKPSHLTREQMEERRLTGGRMLRRTLIAYRASRDRCRRRDDFRIPSGTLHPLGNHLHNR